MIKEGKEKEGKEEEEEEWIYHNVMVSRQEIATTIRLILV
jgi:hypothetical protein